MYDIKRNISPYAIVAILCLAIAAYYAEPSRAQIGTATGAVVGAAVAAAFVSNPVIAALGGIAGSVAGYRYAREKG